MSLDATDCPVQEAHPFDRELYSFKFNGAGLKYEIGVSIRGGNIVWVYGGVPCGEYSDLTLAREAIVHRLSPHERVVDDKVYLDHRFFVTTDYEPESIEV